MTRLEMLETQLWGRTFGLDPNSEEWERQLRERLIAITPCYGLRIAHRIVCSEILDTALILRQIDALQNDDNATYDKLAVQRKELSIKRMYLHGCSFINGREYRKDLKKSKKKSHQTIGAFLAFKKKWRVRSHSTFRSS